MFEVITYPFFNDFLSLCAEARESIILSSPFIKTEIVKNIFKVTKKDLLMELITNINLESFHRKSSDIEAINMVVDKGTVYNHTTLHAKFFIFDSKKCLITSANLTISGLRKNFECGVFTDNPNIVNTLVHKYRTIINDPNIGKLSILSTTQIMDILRNIPPATKTFYPPLDIPLIFGPDIYPIRKTLKGWKKAVFELINTLEDDVFSTENVKLMAAQLEKLYPYNHNREAKIRQILQNLRDIGLIEFTRPGIYRRLWRNNEKRH